ncbi:STAS domain-containing protein [Myxococcota bacterium]
METPKEIPAPSEVRSSDEAQRFTRLLSVIDSAAAGDFSRRTNLDVGDWLGILGVRVDMMIDDMADLVERERKQASELTRRSRELEEQAHRVMEQNELITRQQAAIQELSTPVLQLWDDVLALPVIGVVDTARSVSIMERLLAEICERQSRYVVLDITGVEVVDTKTADHFLKVIQAAGLLGAQCILTGIRPAVAQTLVAIGVDLSTIKTLRTLRDGLRECLRQMDHDPRDRGKTRGGQ